MVDNAESFSEALNGTGLDSAAIVDTLKEVKDSYNKRAKLFSMFVNSIKSPETRKSWTWNLHAYMRHYQYVIPKPYASDEERKKHYRAKMPNNEYLYELLIDSPEQIQERIIHYVIAKQKSARAGTVGNYLNPIHHFYWINGVKGIDWEVIRSFLGEHIKAVEDREYYDDEIRKGLTKADPRGRVLIRLQRQSGVRRGAEPVLNVENLYHREVEGIGRFYKIVVYKGTPDEYFTFCHPECRAEIDSYFEERVRYGEVCRQYGSEHYHGGVMFKGEDKHLDPKAPVIREIFNKKDSFDAKNPKKIDYGTVSNAVTDIFVAAGVRKAKVDNESGRHEVMATHGLRKAFKKRMRQAKVDPIILEYLMGHKNGNPREGITKLMMTYDPEDEQEAMNEFVKAIDHLALNEEHKLKKENVELKKVAENAPKLEALQHSIVQHELDKASMVQEIKQLRDYNEKMRPAVEAWMLLLKKKPELLNDMMQAAIEVKPDPQHDQQAGPA